MDTFARNLMYHINCLRKETRNIESSKKDDNCFAERDIIGRAICDIEIVTIVNLVITDNEDFHSIDMNVINST